MAEVLQGQFRRVGPQLVKLEGLGFVVGQSVVCRKGARLVHWLCLLDG